MSWKELAVVYCRVSTRNQDEDHGGTSLVTQFTRGQKKAEELGLGIYKAYEEVYSGDSYLGRKELQQALTDIESKQARHFICYDFSRYSRNDVHQHVIRQRVEAAGGKLHFCNEGNIDTSTADGHLQFGIKGIFSSNERLRIRERTMTGVRRKVEQQIQPFRAQFPWGYRIVRKYDVQSGNYPREMEGKYVFEDDTAPWAKEVFIRYAAGHSLRGLSKYLFDNGIKTNRGSATFAPTTLKRILANPIYCGRPAVYRLRTCKDEQRIMEGKNETFFESREEAEWVYLEAPALVSEEIWEQCQQRLKENHERLSGSTKCKSLLGGLLRCPRCGRCMSMHRQQKPYYLKSGEKRHYCWANYRCQENTACTNAARRVCHHVRYPAKPLEAQVLAQLETMATNPTLLELRLREQQQDLLQGCDENELKRQERQHRDIERKIETAIQAQMRGIKAGIPTSIYEKTLRDLSQEKTTLEARIQEAQALLQRANIRKIKDHTTQRAELLRKIHEVLQAPDLDVSRKRQLLSTVIDRIVPDENRHLIITFREILE